MADMLVRAGVGHNEVLAIREKGSDPYDIKWWLPATDPIDHLLFRLPAIRCDIKEREKLRLFFVKSKWGKMLGRDIVQAHILPHVVVLGGADQARIDGILRKYQVPEKVYGFRYNLSIHTVIIISVSLQVWNCPFYYDCLVKRTQSVKIVEEFLFLECMMSPEAIATCKRMKKTLKRFAADFGRGCATSLLLTAMRGRASLYQNVLGHRRFSYPAALGAVPEYCAHPPSVPDTLEELGWMSGVWGN